MKRRLSAFGVPALAGLADTLGAAHGLARFGCTPQAAWALATPHRTREAIGSLPVEALRLDAPRVLLLKRLGLRRIGQLYDIPRESLARRFRSLGLDRRQALWEVKALANAPPLPLFAWSETRDTGGEAEVRLPEMALSEHVINDYQTLRLSLKAHPMSFLREDFRKARVISCEETHAVKDSARVQVAGVVLVRQRPGTGNAIFMTIEDETGIANAVFWPTTFERYRKIVMTARLIEIHGKLQKHPGEYADIIHVVSAKLIDRSDWLLRLSEWAADMKAPLANADGVLHPDLGSAHPNRTDERLHPRFSRGPKPYHPRNIRVIPKSRDFH